MKKILPIAAVLFVGFGFHTVAAAEYRNWPSQTTCPISGKKVDGSHYADVDGFRVYTAGAAEAEQVRKNPGQAFAALAKKREAAHPVVWMCPSMKQPVDPGYPFVQQGGKRIYYCCGPCDRRIKSNFAAAANVMKQLAEQGR